MTSVIANKPALFVDVLVEPLPTNMHGKVAHALGQAHEDLMVSRRMRHKRST